MRKHYCQNQLLLMENGRQGGELCLNGCPQMSLKYMVINYLILLIFIHLSTILKGAVCPTGPTGVLQALVPTACLLLSSSRQSIRLLHHHNSLTCVWYLLIFRTYFYSLCEFHNNCIKSSRADLLSPSANEGYIRR